MSDVSVQLVREFFELNAFHVMTCWQHEAVRARGGEHGLQLLVENTSPVPGKDTDLVLRPGEVQSISRAIVEVRAWHADRFYSSVVEANPVLLEVASPSTLARAQEAFGTTEVASILVISELPSSPDPRQKAVQVFRRSGLTHVIEFTTILQDIIERLNAHVSYAPSVTLQTMRLLKRYDFIRRQQLEFAFPTDPLVAYNPPLPETAALSDEDAE